MIKNNNREIDWKQGHVKPCFCFVLVLTFRILSLSLSQNIIVQVFVSSREPRERGSRLGRPPCSCREGKKQTKKERNCFLFPNPSLSLSFSL